MVPMRINKLQTHYRRAQESQQNKELEGRRVGLISFSRQKITGRIRINFNPLLKTVDNIKQELNQLDENLLHLALDLIDSFKWTFSPADVKQPVDFIWYDKLETCQT